MSGIDAADPVAVLARVRAQAAADDIELTTHARRQLAKKRITYDEIREAIASGQLLENYPAYHKGACCLLYGDTHEARPVHVVCSTTAPSLIIITAYESEPPKWITPTRRGR